MLLDQPTNPLNKPVELQPTAPLHECGAPGAFHGTYNLKAMASTSTWPNCTVVYGAAPGAVTLSIQRDRTPDEPLWQADPGAASEEETLA